MEKNFIDLKVSQFLAELGAGNPTPGAGTAAALEVLAAANLVITVIRLTDNRRPNFYSTKLPKLLEYKGELEDRLVPHLEQLFQEDSEKFARVIRLRNERDLETARLKKMVKAAEAEEALKIATDVTLQIAWACVEVGHFALEAFDHGFRSARGDSSVAINMAASALAGCVSIVHLNFLFLNDDAWTNRTRVMCDELMMQLDNLRRQAASRLASQAEQAQRHLSFSKDLKEVAQTLKGRSTLSDNEIEQAAIRLQRTAWKFRDLIWKNHAIENPVEILDPGKILGKLGFEVNRPKSLGRFIFDGSPVEVAGEIDQRNRTVSISSLFPREIQNFTAAHELGHCLMHSSEQVLHRDIPLDGAHIMESRSTEERQADKFASYFLMPEKHLRNVFFGVFLTQTFRLTPDSAMALSGRSVQQLRAKCRDLRGLSRLLAGTTFYNLTSFVSLSKLFKVSTEAMAIRLEELGLVEY